MRRVAAAQPGKCWGRKACALGGGGSVWGGRLPTARSWPLNPGVGGRDGKSAVWLINPASESV